MVSVPVGVLATGLPEGLIRLRRRPSPENPVPALVQELDLIVSLPFLAVESTPCVDFRRLAP